MFEPIVLNYFNRNLLRVGRNLSPFYTKNVLREREKKNARPISKRQGTCALVTISRVRPSCEGHATGCARTCVSRRPCPWSENASVAPLAMGALCSSLGVKGPPSVDVAADRPTSGDATDARRRGGDSVGHATQVPRRSFPRRRRERREAA